MNRHGNDVPVDQFKIEKKVALVDQLLKVDADNLIPTLGHGRREIGGQFIRAAVPFRLGHRVTGRRRGERRAC